MFAASLAKARAIQQGAQPLRVLGGPKVRAFYRALLGDRDAAVVDVWVARAAGTDPQLTPARYARVEAALRDAAAQARTAVADFQATVWVVTRGRA